MHIPMHISEQDHISSTIPVYIAIKNHINPYKPSVLFVEQWQTVQTKIGRRRTRRLIRISTICLHRLQTELKYPSKIGVVLLEVLT